MRPVHIQRNHEPNSPQRLNIFVMDRGGCVCGAMRELSIVYHEEFHGEHEPMCGIFPRITRKESAQIQNQQD